VVVVVVGAVWRYVVAGALGDGWFSRGCIVLPCCEMSDLGGYVTSVEVMGFGLWWMRCAAV
jgi:hypothetical protein